MATDAMLSEAKTTHESSCFIHFSSVDDVELKLFSDQAWNTALNYAKIWNDYDGERAKIAQDLYQRIAKSAASTEQQAGTSTQSTPTKPHDAKFHRKCYQKSTDKVKANQAEKMKMKRPRTQPTDDINDEHDTEEPVPKKERQGLRSRSDVRNAAAGRRRSTHVLPEVCIICRGKRYIHKKDRGTKVLEPLTSCELVDGGQLAEQAKAQHDENILRQIKGKDCVAIEVRYHASCYREYTRPLSRKTKPEEAVGGAKRFNVSFDQFCRDIVDKKFIKDKAVFRLTKLRTIFVKTVRKVENQNAGSYKTFTLKQKLQNRYPQLKFVRPKRRNQSEMVYVDELSTEMLLTDERCGSTEPSDTDTSTDTDSEEDADQLGRTSKPSPDMATLKELYTSALELRTEINAVPSQTMPWPPTSAHLSLENAERLVPVKVFNFIAWMTGLSSEPEGNKFVSVSGDKHRRILSIAQDIIYMASNGRKAMPKQTSLAMAVRHLTGSAQLIGILNGYGHSTSHTVALEHDTALAKKELQQGDTALPTCLQHFVFTTLVWDNNDFGEETLSGCGTTHNTNGIAIQHAQAYENRPPSPVYNVKKTRERSMEAPEKNLVPFFGKKKANPQIMGDQIPLSKDSHKEASESARHRDHGYFFTKLPVGTGHPLLPSWTGYNQMLVNNIPQKATIGYLPIVDSTPTDLSTVNTILHRSVAAANSLHLESIVVVVDQAIYAKAQIIRWQTPLFEKKIVLRLGAFHTAMTFIACIGKRFRDAGLEDVFIESEVLAPGSVNGVMNGRHYNRSVRCHKLMLEALHRLLWQTFLQTRTEEDASCYKAIVTKLQTTFPLQDHVDAVDNEDFHLMVKIFSEFVEEKKKANATFAFWCSYMDMVETLLHFIRSSREGNWPLHLSSIRAMVPWMFAYDRHNYSRYLPVYWMEMQDLPNSHPEIYEEFLKGHFSVQRQDAYGFASVACDMTIEQTVNRDSKTRGGLKGFSVNKGAVNRWTSGHHERASITRQCEEMSGKSQRALIRKDLTVGRMTRDEKDVLCICETIENLTNPFEDMEESSEIVHLASGVVATSKVSGDLLFAQDKGDAAFTKYCEERLQKDDKTLQDTIPKSKLKTFSDLSKTVVAKVNGREISLKCDRDLFARLVIIGKVRKINLQNLMTYSLGPLPLTIAKNDGCLVKTNKAKLLHMMEDLHVRDDNDEELKQPPKGGVWVIDGMALLQANSKGLPRTFGEFSKKILRQLINIALRNQSQCIHFVTDTYPDVSIKNAERKRRAASGSQKVKITRPDQNLPKQWKKFLAGSHNKQQLVRFLLAEWKKSKADQLHGIELIVAHDGECTVIAADESGTVQSEAVLELFCDHEEADTRMLLHAKFIADNKNSTPVIIQSPDTDVFVIAVGLASQISSPLYFHTGKEDKERTIDVGAVQQELGQELTDAIIGFHCFTGCDSVSSFYGKGKTKTLKLLQKTPLLAEPFKELGSSDAVSEEMISGFEEYLCVLYGQKGVSSVNEVRYIMLKTATRAENLMPPNRDSLIKHIQRANFQSSIYKRSLLQQQNLPSPEGNGWKMEEGELVIDWMELAPAPESVLELAFCKCKGTKCKLPDANDACCASLGLRCTDLCQCRNCENSVPIDEEEMEEDEEVMEEDEEVMEEDAVEENGDEDEENHGDDV